MEWMNVGVWRLMLRLPEAIGRRRVAAVAAKAAAIMAEFTEEHGGPHRFVVAELPRAGEALTIERLAEERSLPPATVKQLLDDLGEKKALIARDDNGAVVSSWASRPRRTSSRGSCRHRSTRPRGADFALGARWPTRRAPARNRRYRTSVTVGSSPAITPERPAADPRPRRRDQDRVRRNPVDDGRHRRGRPRRTR